MTKTLVPAEAPAANDMRGRQESLQHDEFAKLVEKCRTQKLSDIIENTSMQHAIILLRGLFQHAASEGADVQIVSGKLSVDVYGPLIPDLLNALDAGCRVDAIALCSAHELEGNTFYSTLSGHNNGSVLVAGKQEESHLHFFLCGNAYRLEVDDSIKKAYASFNDKNGTLPAFLRGMFSRLKETFGARGSAWTLPDKQMA